MIKQFILGFVAISILTQTTFLPLSHVYANTVTSNSYKYSNSTDKVQLIKDSYQSFKRNIDLEIMPLSKASEKFSLELFAYDINEDDMAHFVQEYAAFEDYISYLDSIETAKRDLDGDDFTPEEFSQIAANSLSTLDQESLRWDGCYNIEIGLILVVAAVTMGVIALGKSKGEDKIREEFSVIEKMTDDNNRNSIHFIENHETEIPLQIRQNESNIINRASDIDRARHNISNLKSRIHSGLTDEERTDIERDISSLRSDINSYETSISNSRSRIAWLESEAINYEIIPGWGEQQLDIQALSYKLDLRANEKELQERIAAIPEDQRQARILGVAAGVSLVIGAVVGINGIQACF